MPAVTFTLTDNSAATGLQVTPNPLPAGDASDVITLRIWCSMGTPGGPASGVVFVKPVLIVGPSIVTSGAAFLDENWLYVRLTGAVVNTSNPTMVGEETAWTRIGSSTLLQVPSISADCARVMEVYVRSSQGDGAASEVDVFQLRVIHDEASAPVTDSVGRTGNGIITGIGDYSKMGFVVAPAVTPSGSPDAVVHVGWDQVITRGVSFWNNATDLTLNQDDSASSALTTGQQYMAIITRPWIGGAAVATKGVKAAIGSAVIPTAPASSYVAAVVRVNYGGGGSVIGAADITQIALSDRFTPSVDVLDVTYSPGIALTRGLEMVSSGAETVSLADDSDNFVWRGAAGLVLTATNVPQTLGDLPLDYYLAASGAVTDTATQRVYFEPNKVILRIFYQEEENVADPIGFVSVDQPLAIDRIIINCQTPSSGAAGSTLFDINRQSGGSSATIFTDQGGAVESRPFIVADAVDSTNAKPQVTSLSPGDWLVPQIVSITTGGTRAANFEILFVCSPVAKP